MNVWQNRTHRCVSDTRAYTIMIRSLSLSASIPFCLRLFLCLCLSPAHSESFSLPSLCLPFPLCLCPFSPCLPPSLSVFLFSLPSSLSVFVYSLPLFLSVCLCLCPRFICLFPSFSSLIVALLSLEPRPIGYTLHSVCAYIGRQSLFSRLSVSLLLYLSLLSFSHPLTLLLFRSHYLILCDLYSAFPSVSLLSLSLSLAISISVSLSPCLSPFLCEKEVCMSKYVGAIFISPEVLIGLELLNYDYFMNVVNCFV